MSINQLQVELDRTRAAFESASGTGAPCEPHSAALHALPLSSGASYARLLACARTVIDATSACGLLGTTRANVIPCNQYCFPHC